MAARWHAINLQRQQGQQQAAQMNAGSDDQQAQLQMLFQQQTAQGQPQQQTAQQMPQQQTQNQHPLQMSAQGQQGINPMANNIFQRNVNLPQDTGGTLAMNMQNYIQSQQQVVSQQQRAQQHAAQQQPQPQQPQPQPQQSMLRPQFNINQTPGAQTNMNSVNPYTHQQQAYAANLAAQQRQGGLSTLNQPINPTMQAQQAQQTPQQRPGQFPQIPDNNSLKDPSMFSQQLRNPLQSPAQLQQQHLGQAEIQKMGEDIATYKYYMQYITKAKGVNTDTQPHLKEQYDRAMHKFSILRTTNPGLTEQLQQYIAAQTAKLEASIGLKVNQGVGNDGSQAAGVNVQQPVTNVQQHLQQGQAGQKQQQQLGRVINQGVQSQDQMGQLSQPQVSMPQLANMRAQAQAIARSASGQGVGQQMSQQPQQSIPQQGQSSNPMQSSSMSPQQLLMLQQLQFQQQRQIVTNQQMLANLGQTGGIPANQMTQIQLQQLHQMRQQQPQQGQPQLQQARGGENTSGVVNPNQMIPPDNNPHNFPIPFDTQQRLVVIGVPADRLMSWKDVIDWLHEALKASVINEDQYAKVKAEYQQVANAISTNPRFYQMQMRNPAGVGAVQAHTQQQLLSQMQQARQLPGQQVNLQRPLQNSPQTGPQPMQMNMAGMPQIPQQISPPQAPPLQAQQSQQAQQPPQVTAAQQRKARLPPKKAPAKKGQDASNPMVIGNTPTPTTMPTPSPAQNAASLPTTTPMNVASPAGLHHPGSTPQGLGISPADTHTPSQGDSMQAMMEKNSDYQTAIAFVRVEMEKIKVQMTAVWANKPAKNLSQEEKDQMKMLLSSKQTQDYVGRIDKLAPFLYIITKDEARVSSFLRLVFTLSLDELTV
jgi:hypothetical protein